MPKNPSNKFRRLTIHLPKTGGEIRITHYSGVKDNYLRSRRVIFVPREDIKKSGYVESLVVVAVLYKEEILNSKTPDVSGILFGQEYYKEVKKFKSFI